jgi:hypothetical protein
VQYTAGVLQAIFAAYDLVWLIPVIPLLSFAPEVLATLCATDPPAIPSFTALEVLAMVSLNFGTSDYTTGIAKLSDLAKHLAWYDLCQCNSGGPTPVVPPAQPTGTPTPSITVGASSCQAGLVSQQSTPTPWATSGSNTNQLVAQWNNTPTVLTMDLTLATFSGPGWDPVVTFNFCTSSTSVHVGNPFTLTLIHDTTKRVVVPVPPTALGIVDNWTGPGGTTSIENFSVNAQLQCGPSQSASPCGADPITQATLDSILRIVTLIQRQSVPFAYVPGTVHTALSGSGVISISGLLGAKVAVTTMPGSLGTAGTSPVEYFDVGWVTFGTPDGYPTATRIEHNPQIILPARCSAYTDLAYDFHTGVVATITELVREP